MAEVVSHFNAVWSAVNHWVPAVHIVVAVAVAVAEM